MATTRTPVIPGATPQEQAVLPDPAQVEGDDSPPTPEALAEAVRLQRDQIAYLMQVTRDLKRDVKALNPIGERAVKVEPVLPTFEEAQARARETGKFVLSSDGYVGPRS